MRRDCCKVPARAKRLTKLERFGCPPDREHSLPSLFECRPLAVGALHESIAVGLSSAIGSEAGPTSNRRSMPLSATRFGDLRRSMLS